MTNKMTHDEKVKLYFGGLFVIGLAFVFGIMILSPLVYLSPAPLTLRLSEGESIAFGNGCSIVIPKGREGEVSIEHRASDKVDLPHISYLINGPEGSFYLARMTARKHLWNNIFKYTSEVGKPDSHRRIIKHTTDRGEIITCVKSGDDPIAGVYIVPLIGEALFVGSGDDPALMKLVDEKADLLLIEEHIMKLFKIQIDTKPANLPEIAEM